MSPAVQRRTWLPILAVGLLATLSGWVYFHASQPPARGERASADNPDAFASSPVISGYDENGVLQYRLWAERMQHYPRNDRTELISPFARLHRAEGAPWEIEARTAQIRNGGQRVDLQGDVELHRRATRYNKPADAYTETLRLWPERDYAETDDKITYLTTNLRVEAVGMRAHLDTGDLELVSQVRGVHTPSQAN